MQFLKRRNREMTALINNQSENEANFDVGR